MCQDPVTRDDKTDTYLDRIRETVGYGRATTDILGLRPTDRQLNRDIPATPTTFSHAAPPRYVRARGRAHRGSPSGRTLHYRAVLLTLYDHSPRPWSARAL